MIYTFYSFKGGVGRSMALANVAELLYRQGSKVLIIDFDLEAPGLEGYFNTPEAVHQPMDIVERCGVIDLLLSYKEMRSLPQPKQSSKTESESPKTQKSFPHPVEPISSFIIPIYEQNSASSSLSIIPAGKRKGEEFTSYAQRVRSFDWDDFYTNWDGEQFFEWFRLEVENLADYVLIDSRTGVTEISGVCTYHLADAVIMFVSPNQQNLDGTLMMAKSLSNPKLIEDGRKGRPLSLVFVPSRVEQGEANLLDQFAKKFDETLIELTAPGLRFEKNAFIDLKIPYVPYYAFMENVAVREPQRASAADLIEAFEKLVAALKQLDVNSERLDLSEGEQPQGVEQELRYDPRNSVFYVPYRSKGGQVIGREDALVAVRKQLTEGRRSAIGQTAAFQGLGGLGKTQLAVEYAYRFKDEYPNGVIWLNADQDIDAQLVELAEKGRWIAPESEHKYKLEVARQRLRTYSDTLIVFDNLELPETIHEYLPEPAAEPHIIVTSRIDQPKFNPILLDPLNDSLSFELLIQEAGRKPVGQAEETAAHDIIIALGGLPLALEMAGAYLRHRPISWQQYRDLLTQNIKAALPTVYGKGTKHEADLYSALKIDEDLFAEEPRLREILDLLTWSGSAPMGLSLMCALLDVSNPFELTNALGLGISVRILQKIPSAERFTLHRLVQKIRREDTQLEERQEWVSNICNKIGDWFQLRKENFIELPQFEAEFDHLKAWQEHALSVAPEHASRLVWLQGYPSYQRGRYSDAKVWVERSLELFEKYKDVDMHLEASLLDDLGKIHNALGNYRHALDYTLRSLSIRLALRGEQHPETGYSLDDISNIYRNLGDNRQALDYAKRALSIRSQTLGEHHPDTASSLSNLGRIYRALGEPKRALEYADRALQMQMELVGEKHPDTASSLNGISNTYRSLGDHKRALEYAEKALAIRLELFGERHPDTATSYSSVGVINGYLADHERALAYAEKALAIRLELLGERHPDTALSLSNIGDVYRALGDNNRALEYAEKALKLRREFLGQLHPDSVTSVVSVAHILTNLDRREEALHILDEASHILPKDTPSHARVRSQMKQLLANPLRPGFRQPSSKKKRKKK
jgi:tetratricopeptide (TPR) repeat protein/Mrp family chromosome partitioning ATPase